VYNYPLNFQTKKLLLESQRLQEFMEMLNTFKSKLYGQFSANYNVFLKLLSPEQKLQNLECMRRVLYGLPLENITKFYSKEFFYILEKDDENNDSTQDYLVPIAANFYNLIKGHHPELVSDFQEAFDSLCSCGIEMPSVKGIMLEKNYIEHIKISK